MTMVGIATRKWEYLLCQIEPVPDAAQRSMDALGDQGWELVQLKQERHQIVGVFKRPKGLL